MQRNKPIYGVGDKIMINLEEVKKDIKVAKSFIDYIPKHNDTDLFITKVYDSMYFGIPNNYLINDLFRLHENEIILVEKSVQNEN